MFCKVVDGWCFHSLPPICVKHRCYLDEIEDCGSRCLNPESTYYTYYVCDLSVNELWRERDAIKFFIDNKMHLKVEDVCLASLRWTLACIERELSNKGQPIKFSGGGSRSGKSKEKKVGEERMRVVL